MFSDISNKTWLKLFALALAINTAIAAMLVFLLSGQFWVNFIISQSIGLSVFLLQYSLARMNIFSSASRIPLLILATVCAGTMLGIIIASSMVSFILEVDFTSIFQKSNMVNVMRTTMIGLFFGLIISYFFYMRFRLARHARERELQRLAADKQLVEARLKLIQAQIEPHFLFNTLANIVSLVDEDSRLAKKMLNDLNLYLRTVLNRTREGCTTLEEEIGVTSAYLDLTRARMGARLDFDIEADKDLLPCRLPPLLLQPLVENAVQHGLEPMPQGGSVSIVCTRNNDTLRLRVDDNGAGLGETDTGKGIGLQNIRNRLELLYDREADLKISGKPEGGVRAELILPWQAVKP